MTVFRKLPKGGEKCGLALPVVLGLGNLMESTAQKKGGRGGAGRRGWTWGRDSLKIEFRCPLVRTYLLLLPPGRSTAAAGWANLPITSSAAQRLNPTASTICRSRPGRWLLSLYRPPSPRRIAKGACGVDSPGVTFWPVLGYRPPRTGGRPDTALGNQSFAVCTAGPGPGPLHKAVLLACYRRGTLGQSRGPGTGQSRPRVCVPSPNR